MIISIAPSSFYPTILSKFGKITKSKFACIMYASLCAIIVEFLFRTKIEYSVVNDGVREFQANLV